MPGLRPQETSESRELSHDRGRDAADTEGNIIAQILALIRRRNYDPGDRLPSERELAERFRVGRGAIREALTKLETIRIIERRPNAGVFLSTEPDTASPETLVLYSSLGFQLDEATNAQCLEVRRLVEIQGARLACERRSEADLQALESIVDRFDIAIADRRDAGALDYDFHIQVLRATGNLVLVQIVNPFYMMSFRRRKAYFGNNERAQQSNAEHRQIAAAIRSRDAELAARIVDRHLRRVEQFFLGREHERQQDAGSS